MNQKTSKPQITLSINKKIRVGIVVPHIFMQGELLPEVIFSPGYLALDLANNLSASGLDVKLFTPGPVQTSAENINADLSYFQQELSLRGYGYIELIKKHPATFISLSRQVQSELIAKAFVAANNDYIDIVHIYTNEEDIALPFSALCTKPVVFTHHDPFNFLITYRNVFPKYADLNWVSISLSQRKGMPAGTNWVGNVYHGIPEQVFNPTYAHDSNYLVYCGRIIESKGVHLAIKAVKAYNSKNADKKVLKIAGKHYAGHKKDTYWQSIIAPEIDGKEIIYLGFLNLQERRDLFSMAIGTIMPSIFEEPFGITAIESLASATPVIGLNSGALPEIIKDEYSGFIVKKVEVNGELNENSTADGLSVAISKIHDIDRNNCRTEFDSRFTSKIMSRGYSEIYTKLVYPKG